LCGRWSAEGGVVLLDEHRGAVALAEGVFGDNLALRIQDEQMGAA